MSKERIQKQFPDGEPNYQLAIDIGTSKICIVAGKFAEGNDIRILGVGEAESKGLSKGVVTDIEEAEKSIKKAIEECRRQSDIEPSSVFIGISGDHIFSKIENGVISVKGDRITNADIERVMDSARAMNLPDKQLIHLLPLEYRIDGMIVENPLGMQGMRLETNVLLVFGAKNSISNIIRSCNGAGVDVIQTVLEPIASAKAVLDSEEGESGVLVIDIGGGTTNFIVLKNNNVVFTEALPIGGEHVTKDISYGLRVSHKSALGVKHKHGLIEFDSEDMVDTVELHDQSSRGKKVINKEILALVIRERYSEIFEKIYNSLSEKNLASQCLSGAVITGGGSMVKGVDRLAEKILKMPVRIGIPRNFSGLDNLVNTPIYSTSLGLLRYSLENRISENHQSSVDSSNHNYDLERNPNEVNVLDSTKTVIKQFFKKYL